MGIIHRDIKPENVLLDAPNGNVRIADFNSAYVGPSSDALEDGAVYARDKVGSAPYMAYEVLQGRWYGKMVDWWSLGCLVYDLTTGSVRPMGLFLGHIKRVLTRVATDSL